VVRYRRLTARDVRQVQSVAIRSWKFTYAGIYSIKTIERRVSSDYSDLSFARRVLPRVRRGVDWFYVAFDGNLLIGFSYIGRGRHGWELIRLYLLPEYVRKGIGKKLLRLGENFLRRKNVTVYVVFAHARNRHGIEFYLRNGFTRVSSKDVGGEVCLEKNFRTVPKDSLRLHR
jgi:ribosomal protein S18 acetylase RimI-like enzyme